MELHLHPSKRSSGGGNMSNIDSLVDRISDLHDDLKERILARLPLVNAIQTSQLSRKWRHTWTRMKLLVFDESFFVKMGIITKTRLTKIVEIILFAHQGRLMYFYVDIPEHLRSELHMNGWFMRLARKVVQGIEIHSLNCRYIVGSVPSYFFDCGRLTHLYLESCELNLPSDFQGFPYLTHCFLDKVNKPSNELAEFTTKCVRLERLTLVDLLGFFSEPLHIYAPNLKNFHCDDCISGMIIMKYAPCLTVVSLTSLLENIKVEHKTFCRSFELLSSLSGVEELIFYLPLLNLLDGECPDNLGNEFRALKALTLSEVNICSPSEVSFMFCFLRSAPNLKTLNICMHYIKTHVGGDEVSVGCLEAEGKKEYNISQLVEVSIDGITGLKCETMLVKTILSNCPVLSTLNVEASKNIESEAEKKMAWELNRCGRLSRYVELVFSKAD